MFMAKTNKKTAIFLADGFEEVEALTTYDLLYRAGITCTKVSITSDLEVTSAHDVTMRCDTTVDALDFSAYDMIILPGGMPGTTNLRGCKKLCEEVSAFAKEGKQLAAICAAPSIFAELGLLRDVPATCYPSMGPVLTKNGAVLKEEPVVVSGNITTSRGVGTAIAFGLSLVSHYMGQEVADKLAADIVYR